MLTCEVNGTGLLEAHADDSYCRDLLERTSRLLSAEALERLRTARVLIAGCGGVGGGVALTLARLGVGRFTLADPGRFDAPDANRQWGADQRTLERNKAEVYQDLLTSINPASAVRVYREGVTIATVDELVADADVVIDCLDVSVDIQLRGRLFELARERGLHSITAPVLGFGTLIAIAAPDGLGMEAYLKLLVETSQTGRLPAFVRDFFTPAAVSAIERDLATGKVPSLSIGPVLASGLVATEVLCILLGERLDNARPPVCLPRVTMIDALQARHAIVTLPSQASPATWDIMNHLQAAAFNTSRVPASAVPLDLLTDSWGELAAETPTLPRSARSAAEAFQELFGYQHAIAVNRGRFAEAILAAALIKPGATIACNTLFPTTRFHIESRGGQLVDLSSAAGSVDLERLQALPELAGVWLEPCANALGGQPIALEQIQAIHETCRARGVPLVLDASRLIDNAVLLDDVNPAEMLRKLTACSDACTLSAMKSFRVKHGGFIATHDERLAVGLRDLTLAFGTGLNATQQQELADAIEGEDTFALVQQRVQRVQALHQLLVEAGLPVLAPAGAHGVFVDMPGLLPHLDAEQFPVQAMSAELYRRAGIRGGAHVADPGRYLRLAWPIGCHADADIERIAVVLADIQRQPESVPGLKRTACPPGIAGANLASYEPV